MRNEAPRTTLLRWMRFNAVGLAGIGVQLAALSLLVRVAHANYLPATALAVEAAVLHNFLWHRVFTWRDRPTRGLRASLDALLRFNLTTGLFSIGGNVLLMRLLAGTAGLDPLIANALAIGVCSIVNFLVSDRFVFVVTES